MLNKWHFLKIMNLYFLTTYQNRRRSSFNENECQSSTFFIKTQLILENSEFGIRNQWSPETWGNFGPILLTPRWPIVWKCLALFWEYLTWKKLVSALNNMMSNWLFSFFQWKNHRLLRLQWRFWMHWLNSPTQASSIWLEAIWTPFANFWGLHPSMVSPAWSKSCPAISNQHYLFPMLLSSSSMHLRVVYVKRIFNW